MNRVLNNPIALANPDFINTICGPIATKLNYYLHDVNVHFIVEAQTYLRLIQEDIEKEFKIEKDKIQIYTRYRELSDDQFTIDMVLKNWSKFQELQERIEHMRLLISSIMQRCIHLL